MKKHLLLLKIDEIKPALWQTFCNLVLDDKSVITKDSTKVTCKNCLRAYSANQKQREETDERS